MDWISSLSLPNSTMGDTTVLMLFDTVQQRQNFQDSIPRIATAQGVVALRDSTMQTSIMTGPDQAMLPQQLFMAELDLRNVVLQVETFGVIRSPVLRTLSLENQECLTDPCLHGILTGCPVLQVRMCVCVGVWVGVGVCTCMCACVSGVGGGGGVSGPQHERCQQMVPPAECSWHVPH